MGLSRQMRRQQERFLKKSGQVSPTLVGLESLSKLASDLTDLATEGATMHALAEQLPAVMESLEETRNTFSTILEETREIRFELDRQRWVSLRVAACVHPIDASNITAVLALEEQFRAEYNAMRLLQATLALLDDREP